MGGSLVIGSRHTGIITNDINKSLEFYRDILGLNLIQDFHDNEKYVTACNYCKGRGYGYGTIKAAIQTKKPIPINRIPN